MKKIRLSQKKYALVDEADFEYLSQWQWYYNKGYAARGEYNNGKPKMIYMHRVVNNTPLGLQTDHINMNKLDNRRKNLRSVTRQQNSVNIGKLKTNTSGYKGVFFRPRRSFKQWMAQISFRDKSMFIGYFDSPEQAYQAYSLKAKELYGSYAGGIAHG